MTLSFATLFADIPLPKPKLKDVPSPDRAPAIEGSGLLTSVFENGSISLMIAGGVILAATVAMPVLLYRHGYRLWWLPSFVGVIAYVGLHYTVQTQTVAARDNAAERVAIEVENEKAMRDWQERDRERQNNSARLRMDMMNKARSEEPPKN